MTLNSPFTNLHSLDRVRFGVVCLINVVCKKYCAVFVGRAILAHRVVEKGTAHFGTFPQDGKSCAVFP